MIFLKLPFKITLPLQDLNRFRIMKWQMPTFAQINDFCANYLIIQEVESWL